MEIIILVMIFSSIAFIAGVFIGKRTRNNDGFIYLEKNENGDDRIRFYLNMEYDDIANHEQIVFKVVNENKP